MSFAEPPAIQPLDYATSAHQVSTPKRILCLHILAFFFFGYALLENIMGPILGLKTLTAYIYHSNGTAMVRLEQPPVHVLMLQVALPILFLLTNIIGAFLYLMFFNTPNIRSAARISRWCGFKFLIEGLTAIPQIMLLYWIIHHSISLTAAPFASLVIAATIRLLAGIAFPLLTWWTVRRPTIRHWFEIRDHLRSTNPSEALGVPW